MKQFNMLELLIVQFHMDRFAHNISLYLIETTTNNELSEECLLLACRCFANFTQLKHSKNI